MADNNLFGRVDFEQMRLGQRKRELDALPPIQDPSITPSTLGGQNNLQGRAPALPSADGPIDTFLKSQGAQPPVDRPLIPSGSVLEGAFGDQPAQGSTNSIFALRQGADMARDRSLADAGPATAEREQFGSIGAQVADIADAMGLTGSRRESFLREQTQAQTTKEAKSGVGARAVISSLEKEGMTRDEIRKAIGGTEGKSKAQALSELNRLQRSRTKARADGGIDAKVRDRVVEGARFDTDEAGNDIPKNTEARAKQFMDRADDLGPDPQSDSSLYDSMKPSEKRQYDRTVASMSQGTKNPNAERRLGALMDKAEERSERTFLKKQADLEQKALTLAAKRAQTADDNAQRQLMKDRIQGWKTELETIDDQYKKANRTEKKRLDARRQEIFGNIESFNKGMEVGAQAGAEATAEAVDNTVTPELAQQLLQEAGGDKEKARQLATDRGLKF